MENRNVGYLLLGVAVLVVLVIFLFNNAMKDIVMTSCGPVHGPVCPMNETIATQTYLALGIAGLVVVIALFLVFSKQSERVILKKVEKKAPKREYNLSELKKEEKAVFKMIEENGTIFQADLIEKTGFSKAKMTRIIDRLEGNGFVERKRRGMTNVVVLKG
jgi:uncharacterized membrane protein